MDYNMAIESRDFQRIDKLDELENPDTFWEDVRSLTKNVKSDHAIKRWQILAEYRYKEITERRK